MAKIDAVLEGNAVLTCRIRAGILRPKLPVVALPRKNPLQSVGERLPHGIPPIQFRGRLGEQGRGSFHLVLNDTDLLARLRAGRAQKQVNGGLDVSKRLAKIVNQVLQQLF